MKKIKPIISVLLFAAMLLTAYPFAIKAMGEAHGLWEDTADAPELSNDPPEGTTAPEITRSPESAVSPNETTASSPETTTAPFDNTTVGTETDAPEKTTTSPADTTKIPSDTTKAPADTTKTPAETTKAPETSALTPETTYYDPPSSFVNVDKSYFDDALFIGDSRTVGVRDYSAGKLSGATFFCNTGLSASKARKNEVEVYSGVNSSGTKTAYGTYTLEGLLTEKKFKKIYIMVGINELGGTVSNVVYGIELLGDMIHNLQPDAIIFYCANLHVTKAYSDKRVNKYISNEKMDEVNAGIAELADGKSSFYIDINEYFDDENHTLNASYSGDGVHVYGKYYRLWSEWYYTKGIVR